MIRNTTIIWPAQLSANHKTVQQNNCSNPLQPTIQQRLLLSKQFLYKKFPMAPKIQFAARSLKDSALPTPPCLLPGASLSGTCAMMWRAQPSTDISAGKTAIRNIFLTNRLYKNLSLWLAQWATNARQLQRPMVGQGKKVRIKMPYYPPRALIWPGWRRRNCPPWLHSLPRTTDR